MSKKYSNGKIIFVIDGLSKNDCTTKVKIWQ